MRVDGTSYEDAVERVVGWAEQSGGRYVCVATVHMTMESYDRPSYRQQVNGADLVTPDGMPLVWALRLLGLASQERVYGPQLTLRLLGEAERRGIAVGFFGGTDETLAVLQRELKRQFPALQIAFAHAPPFRQLTAEEDRRVVAEFNASGARILFVGLGCPKQEQWMFAHRQRLDAVMLGVGAAFDFLSGAKNQAPRWMQEGGLEWLFRLLSEPRRLWRRYLYNNPRFVALLGLQLARTALERKSCGGPRTARSL
jgi:N-acetylglucosaminyldiphosphoundecaprenol N-acetyl-beta-D-mannosaminyltransferase